MPGVGGTTVCGNGYTVTVWGSAIPTVGARVGSLNDWYFWVVEYVVIAVPSSGVHCVVVVVVVWADASPAAARNADAATIENSDFLMGGLLMPLHGLNKFQSSGERQDRAQVAYQLMNELTARYVAAPNMIG